MSVPNLTDFSILAEFIFVLGMLSYLNRGVPDSSCKYWLVYQPNPRAQTRAKIQAQSESRLKFKMFKMIHLYSNENLKAQ